MSTVLQKDSETPARQEQETQSHARTATPSATQGRAKAFTIFFIVLAAAAIAGTFYWLHVSKFETTDDAEVDGHLNAISSRVEGTVSHVYVDDNQTVKPGDPLVDLDPRDFQVALDAAEAQLAQARTMVVAQQPNVPITQRAKQSPIFRAPKPIWPIRQAALATAERDVETDKAKLPQAQANNEKAQADLARYKTLIAKEEVSQQEFDSVGFYRQSASRCRGRRARHGGIGFADRQSKARASRAGKAAERISTQCSRTAGGTPRGGGQQKRRQRKPKKCKLKKRGST